MFALINTARDVTLSWHRTREAAERADARLQSHARRVHGKDSCIPTVIRRYRYAIDRTDNFTGRTETKREAMRVGVAMTRGLVSGGRVVVRSPAGDVIAEWIVPPRGQGRIRRAL